VGDVFIRYSARADDFRVTSKGGLTSGTYATSAEDAARIQSGFDATKRYALPSNKPAIYRIEIRPPAGTPIKVGRVAPARGVEGGIRSGGGIEVEFPNGVPEGSVKPLQPIRRR
jgi:hypothetical protein